MNILKKITAAILLLCMVLSCAACGNKTEDAAPDTLTQTTQADDISEETSLAEVVIPEAKPDVAIETPYATMYFPGDWSGFLQTSTTDGDVYTVEFRCRLESGREQPLFAISFGAGVDEPIGAVKTSNGKLVNVGVVTDEYAPDGTWSDSEINIVYNMLNCLNSVLESLDLQEAAAEGQSAETTTETKPAETTPASSGTLPAELQDDMAIDTPYGELHYPVKWADYLSIQVSEGDAYSVGFYCALEEHEEVLLFTIHFGGSQGSTVATISSKTGGTVEVRVSLTELNLDETWIDNDVGIAYSMQEDVNYLLSAITG